MLLFLLACAGTLTPGFEATLTRTGGCGDVKFFAVDEADTLMLTAEGDGLFADAGDDVASYTFTLPDPAFAVVVERGRRVSDATCDDVIENGGPQVTSTWEAEAGEAIVTIDPVGEEAVGTLELYDVVFAGEVLVPTFTIEGVQVGWYAG